MKLKADRGALGADIAFLGEQANGEALGVGVSVAGFGYHSARKPLNQNTIQTAGLRRGRCCSYGRCEGARATARTARKYPVATSASLTLPSDTNATES